MVTLQAVHAHNAGLAARTQGFVAVFVGGTSGIALSTAQALARHTPAPKIYLIGRSATAAATAIAGLKTINPSAQPTFLQADISQLKAVDTVCAQIATAERALNLLFMTPGYVTTRGRDETPDEGLDRKFALHYYVRMRFLTNLQPLLDTAAATTATATATNHSRVVSVLDPHGSVRGNGAGTLDYDDLSLKTTFSLARCAAHATLMTDFFLEAMAARHPTTAYVHAYPSLVATGVFRDLPGARVLTGLMKVALRPWTVGLEESGERHLYAATSESFAARAAGVKGEGGGVAVAVGSDGVKGSGSYWLNWDGQVYPPNNAINATREQGAVDKVVRHTEEVFKRICEEGKTYP